MKLKPNLFLGSAVFAALTLVITGNANATVYAWDGGASTGNWQTANNWNPNASNLDFNGSFANRLNVNSSQSLTYTSAEGNTIYTGDTITGGGRGLVIGSGIGGSGSMTITGGSFSTLGSPAADIIGNSDNNTGILTINGGDFIGTAAGTSLGNGTGSGRVSTLNVQSGSATIATLNMNSSLATINLSGTGLLSVDNISKTAGTANINFDGGTLKARTATTNFLTGLNNATINGGGGTVDSSNLSITIAQNLQGGTGSGGLTKMGSGTLALTGTNTYTGLTTVNAGELRISSATALNGTSGITVSATGAGLSLNGGISVGSGKTVSINGTGIGSFNAFGALTNNGGDNTWAGNVTIGSAAARIGSISGNLTISGVIDSGAVVTGLTVRLTNSTTNLTLSNANTYLGDTLLITAGGSLILSGGANRLPTATNLQFGASNVSGLLDLNGQNQEVAGISVNSGTANEIKSATSATLTVNTAAASSTFSANGKITGSIGLVKQGGNNLTLQGTNTYSGNTTVTGGTLALSGGGSINNSALIDVQSAGTLSIAGVTTSTTVGGTTAQTLKGLGTVELGSKILTIGGSGTLAPGASPGTLEFTASTGKLDFASGSEIAFELGTSSDLISFSSAGDWLTGSGNSTLALDLLSGFDYGNTYTIFENVTTGGFTFAAITGYDTVGYSANFFQNGNNYDLSFTVIPEPNVAALLGALATLILLRRRRV